MRTKWRDRSNSYRCFSIACTASTVLTILGPIKWGWEIGIVIWWALWTAALFNLLQKFVIQQRLSDSPNLDRD